MATTFKEQLLDNDYLPHNLRDKFYQRMKQTVVVVRVCYDSKTPPTYWGGVCVGPEGLVVTAAHILVRTSKSIAFRCPDESDFVPANVLHTDMRSDLLLLRRKKIGDDLATKIPYVEFCPDTDIQVGMEAIAIGHPCNLVYTIAIGHVAFPACGIDDPYEKVPCADKTPNTRRMMDCKIGDCKDLEVHRDDLQLIQLNNIHGSSTSAGSAIFTSAGLLLGVEIFVHSKFDFCVHKSVIKHFTEQGLQVEKAKRKSSHSLPEMMKIKYPKAEQKGRGKEGRKGNIVSLTKLRTDREHVKPQISRPFEDVLVRNRVQLPHGLSEQILATGTSNKILQNPLSSIAPMPVISIEKQAISVRDSRLYDNTNLFSRMSKSNINMSSFTMRREMTPVRFFESKLEVPSYSASAAETVTNPDSSRPSCITNFITKKRLLLHVSPTINKKLKASPPIDKKLLLGTANSEAYQGNAFMDNLGYSNCVPELKSMANFELPILVEGNVEKAEACTQELDDVLGGGYQDEPGCSKYMVDVELPVMSQSQSQSQSQNNASVERALACARELDDVSTYLKLSNASVSTYLKQSNASVDKALGCVRELDDICNMLRKKSEEAKELLAVSLANNNALMLLNHPMHDPKFLALEKRSDRFKSRKW